MSHICVLRSALPGDNTRGKQVPNCEFQCPADENKPVTKRDRGHSGSHVTVHLTLVETVETPSQRHSLCSFGDLLRGPPQLRESDVPESSLLI